MLPSIPAQGYQADTAGAQNRGMGRTTVQVFSHCGGDLPSQGPQQDWTLVGEYPSNPDTECSWQALPQFLSLGLSHPLLMALLPWPDTGLGQAQSRQLCS